jgi:Flp pilus assembly protein TadB
VTVLAASLVLVVLLTVIVAVIAATIATTGLCQLPCKRGADRSVSGLGAQLQYSFGVDVSTKVVEFLTSVPAGTSRRLRSRR